MKKLCLLFACILGISLMNTGFAIAEDKFLPKTPPCDMKMQKPHQHPDFSKLNLTEEQKAKLDENRKQSREKMKPIILKMKENKTRIEVIKASTTLSEDEKVEKITQIKKEMRELRKEANEIRQADMKFFEEQLTPKQKKVFEEIKKEQFNKMEKARKHHKNCHKPIKF